MLHKIDMVEVQPELSRDGVGSSARQAKKNFKMSPEAKQILDNHQARIQQDFKTALLEKNVNIDKINSMHYMQTTIYNESLFSAWGDVLHATLPTIQQNR